MGCKWFCELIDTTCLFAAVCTKRLLMLQVIEQLQQALPFFTSRWWPNSTNAACLVMRSDTHLIPRQPCLQCTYNLKQKLLWLVSTHPGLESDIQPCRPRQHNCKECASYRYCTLLGLPTYTTAAPSAVGCSTLSDLKPPP